MFFNTEQDETIKGQKLFYQPTLLRNLLGILSVSFVMIWVEILVLKYLLLPQINAAVINPVRDLGTKNYNASGRNENVSSALLVDTFFTPVDKIFAEIPDIAGQVDDVTNEVINATVFALEVDEDGLINRTNSLIMLLSFIPWFVVVIIMYVFYQRLKKDEQLVNGHMEIFGFQARATLISTLISIVIFCGFQYAFYEFGIRFEYETTEEMEFEIRKKIVSEMCVSS